MGHLHTDFETRSLVELAGQASVGLHNYATNPSTEVLMLAWAYDDEPVELWEPRLSFMPDKLRKGLEDEKQELAAWNSTFERYIFQYKLKIKLAIKRFQDPQASARYLSLPGDLEKCGPVLDLPVNLRKDKRGDALIDMFTSPTQKKKKKGQPVEFYWRDWNTNSKDWESFKEYCKQDVVAEREIQRRLTILKVFPLPERERKIWIFDQTVNDRGMPVNVQFVKKAYSLASKEKEEAEEKQNQLTGLENANSPKQMLAWAQERGYEGNSLRKESVAAQLENNFNLTDLCKEVLNARKAASSTTYKKLSAILRQVSSDNRLRNQFLYMGSSRCGRWSGNAVQLHNMARPEERFEDLDTMDWLRAMVDYQDYQAIKVWFTSVLLSIKSVIRTVFETKPGKRFNVCDLNAIETRVGAWVSGCLPLLKVFEDDHCPYLDFAVKMTGISYENLERDMKSKDPAIKSVAKRHRQFAKPGVLGCVYRLGGGQMGTNKYGDPVKQGLWGYAEGYGVKMSKDQAHEVVRIFRESYKEICEMWYRLERAVSDVLKEGTSNVKRELGPNGCIKIDKINIEGRNPLLRIQLPSGRYLHYMDARMEDTKMPWQDREGQEVYRSTLVYAGLDQETKQWSTWITSHGGKIFENIVQGIARDVLAESLLKFENEAELPICGHVHDEGISETEDDSFAPGLFEMERIMSEPINWAPGLPLKADGFYGRYYHK